jgi:hypothetical protein
MSNYIIVQHAPSLSEFLRSVKIHIGYFHLYRLPKKVYAAIRFCEYLCDNSQFISERQKLSSTVEETLVKFWKRDSWTAARFYLQRLYPMNSDLSKWRKTFKVFRARKRVQKCISPVYTMLISDLLKIV